MSEKVLNKVNSDIFSYDTTANAFKMARVMPTEIHHSSEGVGQNGYILTSTGDGWTWTNPSTLGISGGGGGVAAVPSNLSNLILNQDGNPDFVANTGNNISINSTGGVNNINYMRSTYNGKYLYFIAPWDGQYFLQYKEYDSTTDSFSSPVNFNSENIEAFIVNKSNTILLTGSYYNLGGGGGGGQPKLTKCYYNPLGEEGQNWTLLGSYAEIISAFTWASLYSYARQSMQITSFDNDNYEIYIGTTNVANQLDIIKINYQEPNSVTAYKKNLPFTTDSSFMSDNYLVCATVGSNTGSAADDMEIWTKNTNPDDIQSNISEYDTFADGWYKYTDVNRDLPGHLRRLSVSKSGNYFVVCSFHDSISGDQSNWIRSGNRIHSHAVIFKKKDDIQTTSCGYEKWTSVPHAGFGTLAIEETDTQLIISTHGYSTLGGTVTFINKSDKTLVTNGPIGTTATMHSGDDVFGAALNLKYIYHRDGGWPTSLLFYKLNMIAGASGGSGQTGSQTLSNLIDTDISNIKNGETLIYDGTNWVNSAPVPKPPPIEPDVILGTIIDYNFRTAIISGTNVKISDSTIATIYGTGVEISPYDGLSTTPNSHIINSSDIYWSQAFTIEIYFKCTANPSSTGQGVLKATRGTGRQDEISISRNGTSNGLYFWIYTGGIYSGITSNDSVAGFDGTFGHVIITHDTNGNKLYVDGIEVSTTVQGPQSPGAFTGDTSWDTFLLGVGGHWSGVSPMDSDNESIKLCRTYNSVLSPEQITELYNNRDTFSNVLNYALVSNNAAGTETAWANILPALTVDTAIINGSANPVTNNAIFDALELKVDFANSNMRDTVSFGGYGYNGLMLGYNSSTNNTISINAYNGRMDAHTFSPYSDDRIKSRSVAISNATETLMMLKPIKYQKHMSLRVPIGVEDTDLSGVQHVTETGFNAQDVQNIPELSFLVHENKEADLLSLNYTSLIAFLTKSIQELNERIKILENK